MKYWLTDTEREPLQHLTSMRGLEKSDAEKQQSGGYQGRGDGEMRHVGQRYKVAVTWMSKSRDGRYTMMNSVDTTLWCPGHRLRVTFRFSH